MYRLATTPLAPTAPTVTFEEITFSDKKVVTLDPEDIVVFVGPNNAGKSVALSELHKHMEDPQLLMSTKIIRYAVLRQLGNSDDIRTFVKKNSLRRHGDRYLVTDFQ